MENTTTLKQQLNRVKFCGLCGLLSLSTFGYLAGYNMNNHIPHTAQVQSGSVVPSKLEITVEDTDNDGQRETLMKYDGKTYRLKLDKDSKPIIQEYQQPVKKSKKII